MTTELGMDCEVKLEKKDVVWMRRKDNQGKWGAQPMCEPCWREFTGDRNRVPHMMEPDADEKTGRLQHEVAQALWRRFRRERKDIAVYAPPPVTRRARQRTGRLCGRKYWATLWLPWNMTTESQPSQRPVNLPNWIERTSEQIKK